MPETLFGLLNYSLEQGSEGHGCWAFQDQRYIRKNVPSQFCRKCGKYIGPERPWPHPVQLELPGIIYCLPGEHEEGIYEEIWDYEGLYVLEEGDVLMIYDKDDPSHVLWSGTIKFDTGINYVDATQEGVEKKQWARWFAKAYPASLIPHRSRKVA